MTATTVTCRMIAGIGVLLLAAGCGSTAGDPVVESTSEVTASGSSSPAQMPAADVVDVNPSDFSFGADSVRFEPAGSPGYECVIGPNPDLGGHDVSCFVAFPPDTPAVTNTPFSGEPNMIVLRPDGYVVTISEGGPPGARPLPENTRLGVGDAQCTALPGGMDCDNGPAGFRFVDGELTVRGPQASIPEPAVDPCGTASANTAIANAVNRLPPNTAGGAGGAEWIFAGETNFDPCADLSYAVAETARGTGSSPQQVMFFHRGVYLGTATRCAFGFTSVVGSSDDSVTVQYRWPRGTESNAEASGRATATFGWNGDRVVMQNDLPAQLLEINGCN
ncbi:hypothetical protein ABH922_000915 [Rhodococcus sp. 27YEA15]|uniref:LppP/LprE family lipoprotein n=1 Tax=Rhodococcus sp. 27YEA15 TaxID=3156259 RepID=UPI003C79ACA3